METPRSFSLRADSYDQNFSEEMSRKATIVDPVIYNHLSSFVQTLPNRARVLDIGSGAGIESWIIENSGALAFPFDQSRHMLNLQQQVGEGLDVKDGFLTRRVRGDILHLPYQNDMFDAACIVHVLQLANTPERLDILKGVHRVIKPGGRFFIVTEEIPESIVKVGQEQIKGPEFETIRKLQSDYPGLPVSYEKAEMTINYLRIILQLSGFNLVRAEQDNVNLSRWAQKAQIFALAEKDQVTLS